MAINVTINAKEGGGKKKKLKIQRNMNGDYVLTEHPELDIVIMPQSSKILMLTKGETTDYLYRTQDKIFKHLTDRGIVKPESIKVGNVFGTNPLEMSNIKIYGADIRGQHMVGGVVGAIYSKIADGLRKQGNSSMLKWFELDAEGKPVYDPSVPGVGKAVEFYLFSYY
jgi:hypothetical protein